MAVEKYIHGKSDDAKHDGRASNVRRLFSALEDEAFGEQLLVSMALYKQRDKLPPEIIKYHEELLTYWGLLPGRDEIAPDQAR